MRQPAHPPLANPRTIDSPRCGFWLTKLRKGAVEVPCCIRRIHTTHEPGDPENVMDRSPYLAAFINGEPVALDMVWLKRLKPITEEEHDYRVKVTDWAMANDKDGPEANPTVRIDHLTVKPPF